LSGLQGFQDFPGFRHIGLLVGDFQISGQNAGGPSFTPGYGAGFAGVEVAGVILKAAVEFEQKNTKDTKSVTCEDPAQI
jgi:hypothetical protein